MKTELTPIERMEHSIANSTTEDGFEISISQWYDIENPDYVWRIREHVELNLSAKLWLGELVFLWHGEKESEYYYRYVSTAYDMREAHSKQGVIGILIRQLTFYGTGIGIADYTIDLKCVCEYYRIPLNDTILQTLDEFGAAMQIIGDRDVKPFWDGLKGLRRQLTKRAFTNYLSRVDYIQEFKETFGDEDIILCRVAPYLTALTDQQKQWLAEYEASAAESEQTAADVPQQTETETEASAATAQASTPRQRLPKELDTPQAKQYFEQAVNAGLLDNEYNWQGGSVVLLSCFCAGMSLTLGLDSQKPVKRQSICWRPFDVLFQRKSSLQKNYSASTPNNVKGIEKVYKLFPALKEYTY